MTKIAGSNPAQGFPINIPSMIATKFLNIHIYSFLVFYYLVFPYSLGHTNIEIGLLVKNPASSLENNFFIFLIIMLKCCQKKANLNLVISLISLYNLYPFIFGILTREYIIMASLTI